MFSRSGTVCSGTRSTISSPKPSRPPYLRRVVGHQPHRRDAEVDEDLRADAVLARVGREAELEVRLDGVAALVLQRVGAQLVAEPDARGPRGRGGRRPRRGPASATRSSAASSCAPQSQRSEPNTSPVRHSECTRTSTLSCPATSPRTNARCSLAVEQRLEHVGGEVAVLRRDARLGDAAHQLLVGGGGSG